MPARIVEFQNEYRFLSNFYPSEVHLDGAVYPSVEAAFQAAKCLDPALRKPFETMNPSQAKRAGRRVDLRPDWDQVRIAVMTELVKDKFTRHAGLQTRLLATGNAELLEGNTWNDTFWGVDLKTMRGENHLGIILMELRSQLRQ